MKISYNWLKWYIPDVPEAEKLSDIITYHLAEVETIEKKGDDSILDIKILPNRAHDLLSHMGIARELASLLDLKYTDPELKYKIPESKPTDLKIKIESDNCRRYMARIIRNVKVGPSPEWVVKHLESVGQRSINNIVDAANLVMFNCGQPTHAFDLNKINGGIVVREAKEGEEMTTLDSKDVKFKPSNMVIADTVSVLAIAGIKGGKLAEVDEGTTDVVLEVANFDPTSVRKTAQALNIFTDARKRFENDLSPELTPYAMKEFSALIAEMMPEAQFEEIVDVYPKKHEQQKLSFGMEKISKVLGLEVSVDEIAGILKRYGIYFTENKGNFEIEVPPMRLDLEIEEDMAEEIGRILGYDKVKGKMPEIDFKPKQNEIYSKLSWTRNKLLGEGYSEVMTYVFRDKGEVSVLASASDKKFLRTNLSDGLGESLKLNRVNTPLLGMNEIKIFEIGTVFVKGGEEMHVAYANKKEIKEMTLEEYVKSASPDAFTQVLGFLGPQPQPDHSQKHAGSASKEHSPSFTMWSLFPFIARDIAVWVPEEVESYKVHKVIKENAGDMLIRDPELFDEFKKEGKISYAFRLVFQSFERTLTDTEINAVMTQITNKIKEKEGWQVR